MYTGSVCRTGSVYEFSLIKSLSYKQNYFNLCSVGSRLFWPRQFSFLRHCVFNSCYGCLKLDVDLFTKQWINNYLLFISIRRCISHHEYYTILWMLKMSKLTLYLRCLYFVSTSTSNYGCYVHEGFLMFISYFISCVSHSVR